MPRWKELPEELDPQIKEFTSQLRRLVDRSGLSVAALADRTGYSKTSWERYLGGRLLAPKGAIVALAEVTGTHPIHLTTMWELAERAWSRSEMRHDMTIEAIRISQARAALSEFGPPPANARGRTAHRGGAAASGAAGPAVPAQPTASDANARTPSAGPRSAGTDSWGVAGHHGPSPAGRRGPGGPAGGAGHRGAGAAGAAAGGGAHGARPGGRASRRAPAAPPGGGMRRTTMFVAGALCVLVVAAGAFWATSDRGTGKAAGTPSPTPAVTTATTPTSAAAPPPGVKCSGDGCTGKDAQSMGCSGSLVTTARTATVGTTVVEVRYSQACGAAWGRITQAVQGDRVEVSTDRSRQQGSVAAAGGRSAYTPMVAVKDAGEANACVTLASGETGCTRQP
ncbi:helix-turn-helix domain-containing protein [Streptomyces glaucescens]|uniref:HTH cro/C1-type domain-containing protein n=1 Tax=Streptomyces glaucescens TaxID=1907 RepID=A0A089XDU7_STRGA|nr:XRE family transcriptional regulator [Streptomyces glaucescens]AIS00102.1 hypothetical protein SGLAU_20740 [Streptomyces glaucescens]